MNTALEGRLAIARTSNGVHSGYLRPGPYGSLQLSMGGDAVATIALKDIVWLQDRKR